MKQSMLVLQALTVRTLKRVLTNPEVLAPSLLGPAFMLVAFTGGLSGLAMLPQFSFAAGYATFLYVALLFQAAGFSGAAVGGTIARDFESGFMRRLVLVLPHRFIIVVAYVITAAVQALFVFLLLTVLGLFLEVRFMGSAREGMVLVMMALLFNYVAVLWGLALAMLFRSSEGALLANMPFLTAIFLSPIYLPVALLQGWVRTVAEWNPLTPLLETGRALIVGQTADVTTSVLVLVGLMVVVTFGGLLSLRQATRLG